VSRLKRLVIGEDDVLLREGIARILGDAGYEVVAQAGDADDLLRKALAHHVDIAIVDVKMPPSRSDDGLRAAIKLRRERPDTGVLVLSQYCEERYAVDLIGDRAEGVGYLLKERVGDVAAFIDAVDRVASGGSALDPEVVARMLGRRARESALRPWRSTSRASSRSSTSGRRQPSTGACSRSSPTCAARPDRGAGAQAPPGDVGTRPARRPTTPALPACSIGAMHNLTRRRHVVAAIAPMLVCLAVLAGCGNDNSSSGPAPVAPSGGAAAVQDQFVKVVDRVSPQVVQIQTDVGLGSGIVYDDRGDIVTNAHVAGKSSTFLVTLSGGARHKATLVGTDPSSDLAVIRMSGAAPTPATFAASSGVRSGDIVFAIGNPLGLQSSVTQGIVSSINRSVGEGNGVTLRDVIQTSAEINPGNSGGALVDLSGNVVGVPTLAALDPEFGDTQASGIGFAITSSTVQRVADRLIASAQ
jgi:putative serine protease PepD